MADAPQTTPASRRIWLQRQPDGSYVDWGRHGPGREGSAFWYRGEAAKVMRLIIQHSEPAKPPGRAQ